MPRPDTVVPFESPEALRAALRKAPAPRFTSVGVLRQLAPSATVDAREAIAVDLIRRASSPEEVDELLAAKMAIDAEQPAEYQSAPERRNAEWAQETDRHAAEEQLFIEADYEAIWSPLDKAWHPYASMSNDEADAYDAALRGGQSVEAAVAAAVAVRDGDSGDEAA